MDNEIWGYFLEHRRRLRAPLTSYGEHLIRKKLERIQKETGDDPTEVLEQSIEMGWKGVFPLVDKRTKPLKDYTDRDLVDIAKELGISTIGRKREEIVTSIKSVRR